MDLQRPAGMLISAGFILYVAAMLAAPQLYQTDHIANRLAIIADNKTRWNLSQLLFALGIGVPAVGFLLLAISQRTTPVAWLYYLGAVAITAGAVVGMWLVFLQTRDPAAFWVGRQISQLTAYGFLLPTLAGLLFFGLAQARGGFPIWLGYSLVASAAILLTVTLVSHEGGAFFISVLAYLVIFVAGVVIWRQG